jgi:fructose-specific phosphotransferase system IIA component
MAITLSELLDPDCIELDLKSRRKKDIIRELAEVLTRGGKISDTEALARGILEREKLTSTGLGDGIAIPHCMSSQVQETLIAFGRKASGVRFDAIDNRPVKLFLLLVGPADDHNRHLKVLSKLARYLHDDAFCRKLLEAENAGAVIQAFREKEQ